MKPILIFFICFFLSVAVIGQSSIYSIKLPGINEDSIDLNSLSGKKIIIAICNSSAPDFNRLAALNTLYLNNQDKIRLILVPVEDFNVGQENVNLKHLLIDSLDLKFLITDVSKGKKINGDFQQSLLRWLTHKESSIHFDTDLMSVNQLFIIGRNGNLFAVLEDFTNLESSIIDTIINGQEPVN